MKHEVYCHTHVESQKRYVGITCRGMANRWKQHLGYAKSKRPTQYFHSAIAKHGPDAFTHEVLEETDTVEAANEAEIWWIGHFCSDDARFGYNLTTGGGSSSPSESARERIRQKLTGVKHTAERRQNLSDAHKGQVAYNKGLPKEQQPCFGFRHTAETHERMRLAALARPGAAAHSRSNRQAQGWQGKASASLCRVQGEDERKSSRDTRPQETRTRSSATPTQPMSQPTSQLPPSHISPRDLWMQLTAIPRPHRIVDFPRKGPDGNPAATLAMLPMTQAESYAATVETERFVRKLLKADGGEIPGSRDRSEGYTTLYENRAAQEVLFRVCKQSDDISKNFFPIVDEIGKQLTVDEIGVMMRQYAIVCAEVGPNVSTMSQEEFDAWVTRLAEGGRGDFLGFLTAAAKIDLLMYMASALYKLRTVSPSPGEPLEAST